MSQNDSKIIVIHDPTDLSLITIYGLDSRTVQHANFVLAREKGNAYIYRFLKNRGGGFKFVLNYPEFKQLFDSCPTARYVEDSVHHCITVESDADLIMLKMIL